MENIIGSPSPKNKFIPIQNTEAKYIIEMNKILKKRDAKLSKNLELMKLKINDFKKQIQIQNKITRCATEFLKKFVEINNTTKQVQAEYESYLYDQEIEFKRIKKFLIIAIGSSLLTGFSAFFGCALLTGATCAYLSGEYFFIKDLHIRRIKKLKTNIKKFKDSQVFINNHIDHL